MKTNYEKLMKINYEKLLIFYLPFTGPAIERRDAIHLAGARTRLLQATDEFQQGGLPHSVFAKQPVDVTFLEAEADVSEDWLCFVTEV